MTIQTEQTSTTQDLVGEVFVSNWGYDQTNIDFYLVTAATPKRITLTAIGAHRDADGYLTPNPAVKGEVLKNKKPNFFTHGVWVKLTTFSGAFLWDGKPEADTWTCGGAGH